MLRSHLQWRQFNFLEKEQIYDPLERSRSPKWLQNMDITSWTNGRGHLIFGDSAGLITLINCSLTLNYSYPAHPSSITHVKIMKYKNILVSVGEDETSTPNIKVWNLDKMNKNTKSPMCLRTIKVNQAGKISPVTAITILDSMSQMAIGLENGTVILMRGDILRDRFTKTRIIHEGKDPITGLGFKEEGKQINLYIITKSSIFLYNTLVKDSKKLIDEQGCEIGCSVVNFHDPISDLIIGKNEAIYFYNSEGRGPCSIIEGEKYQLLWYRNYLVIVTYDKQNIYKNNDSTYYNKSEASINEKTMSITLYDLKNKFIAFSESFSEELIREDPNDIHSKFVQKKGAIRCVCSEWGSLFIFTGDRKMYKLEEIDLSTKLDILFKRNMYTLAINIVTSQNQYSKGNNAEGKSTTNDKLINNNSKHSKKVQSLISKNNEYDYGTLVEIYKKYGDWLYAKNDFDNAMQQYLQTIGQLEPSYVIRKFLDAQRIHNLTSYLQALHEAGLANSDHTTLLLNCYTKLKNVNSLDSFIKSGKEITFDVDTAIRVCRQAGYYEHAIYLAEAFKYYDLYINIQVEDLHNYHDAISYMNKLPFQYVESNINKYGVELVTNIPEHTTELLIRLCTGWDNETIEIEDDLNNEDQTNNSSSQAMLISSSNAKSKSSLQMKESNKSKTLFKSSTTNGSNANLFSSGNYSESKIIASNDVKNNENRTKTQSRLSSFPPFQIDSLQNYNNNNENGLNITGSINAATQLKNNDDSQIMYSNTSRSFQSQQEHDEENYSKSENYKNNNNIIDLTAVAASLSKDSKYIEDKSMTNNANNTLPTENKHLLSANAESFIHLYINQKEWCITFLETVLQRRVSNKINSDDSKKDEDSTSISNTNDESFIYNDEEKHTDDNKILWNTLLELYLSGTNEHFRKNEESECESIVDWEPTEGKIMNLLTNSLAEYDVDHALVLCKTYNFQKGILFLNEKLNLYNSIIQNYFDNENYDEIIETCNKYGEKDPSLWSLALSYFASREKCIHSHLLTVLDKIDQNKLLSPLEVIQILAENSSVTIGTVKDFICRNIKDELKEIEEGQMIIKNYKEDTKKMRKQIDNLKNGNVVFQVTKCVACNGVLDLPSIHFLCKHSYHLRCLGENDQTCPKCAPEHKMITDVIKMQEVSSITHEKLCKQLEESDDHFDTIASYFSKNPFFSLKSAY